MNLPLIYENSKIPVWLSKVSPIEINALSFFIFVFARGESADEVERALHTAHAELTLVFEDS